jgi:hypothetical protein
LHGSEYILTYDNKKMQTGCLQGMYRWSTMFLNSLYDFSIFVSHCIFSWYCNYIWFWEIK